MTQGLFALVNSKSAITDLIGSSPMRFYPKVIPQGVTTMPAGTYRVVVNTDNADFDGASKMDFATIDIHWYSDTYSGVINLYEVSRKALEGVSGTFGGIEIVDVVYMPSGDEDYLESSERFTKRLELRADYIRTP